MSQERERRHRKLLAFSLMEVLIVIAIIAILSGIIVKKWHNMKEIEDFRSCRANILEIVSALEAKRVSDNFFELVGFLCNDGFLYGDFMTKEQCEKNHLPFLTCPLGTVDQYNSSNNNLSDINETSFKNKYKGCSYELRLYNDSYTVFCGIHHHLIDHINRKIYYTCMYEHVSGQAPGWIGYKTMFPNQTN